MSKLKDWLGGWLNKLTGGDELGPEPEVAGATPGSVSHKWALWYSQKHNVSYQIATQIGRSRLRQLKKKVGSKP